jgi:predicted small metal-binding protein
MLKSYDSIIFLHMKTITCRDAGFACDYVVKGETEEEVMKRGAEHAMKDHDMKEEGHHSRIQRKGKRTYSFFLGNSYFILPWLTLLKSDFQFDRPIISLDLIQ